jgi:hypothetical protein
MDFWFCRREGCFTGSFVIDKRSTWGLQPQAEFNIVQNNVDRLLLEASNEHVGNSLKTRDQFLKLALVLKELNAKRLAGHKSDRLHLIIDWLKGFK